MLLIPIPNKHCLPRPLTPHTLDHARASTLPTCRAALSRPGAPQTKHHLWPSVVVYQGLPCASADGAGGREEAGAAAAVASDFAGYAGETGL
jgi:hypothetical protein